MINLVLNELKKIFAKKSLYIIFIIVILLLIGTALLNKTLYNSDYSYFGIEDNVDEFQERLTEIEEKGFVNDLSDEEEWKFLRTELETGKIINRLKENKKQRWKIDYSYRESSLLDSQKEFVEMELLVAKSKDKNILNSKEYKEVKEKYEKEFDEFIKISEEELTDKLIVEKEESIKEFELDLEELIKLKNLAEADSNINEQIANIEEMIEREQHSLNVLNIRKDKKIPYDNNNYMNSALNEYEYLKYDLEIAKNPREGVKSQDVFSERNENYTLKSLKEAEYILETGHEINNPNTANKNIANFLKSNLTLYLIIVVVISGTIVAEEYTKGTIKNLLVVPYKRNKILRAKLLSVLITSIIAFLILILAQILISGIVYDFKTMLDPVVEYNVKAEAMHKYNLFYYVAKHFAYTLPYILVFILFTFTISTITTSSAAAITLGLVSLFATDIVNQLLLFACQLYFHQIR